MQGGDVFVWWPHSDPIATIARRNFSAWDAEKANLGPTRDDTIACANWDLEVEPVRLPSLPQLPDLLDPDAPEADKETLLVKIACFDSHLVGLTNKGHVLKYGTLEDPVTAQSGSWHYVRIIFVLLSPFS
jgi:SCF-associated factor 1